MAFSTVERDALLDRIRYELGYSAVTQTGEPYVSWTLLPDVAFDNLGSGAETTTATAVATADVGTAVTLVLTSGTGFVSNVRIHVDVGAQREVVVAQSVVTTALTARFTKVHAGTYPVEVESGESMLRTLIFKLDDIRDQIQDSFATAGIKVADEVEFFEGAGGDAVLASLWGQRQRWRAELASLLKLPDYSNRGRGATSQLEAYW